MHCRDLYQFLQDYLDGELEPGQEDRFESHLRGCAECEAYVETYRTTMSLEEAAYACEGADAPCGMPEALVRAIVDAARNENG